MNERLISLSRIEYIFSIFYVYLDIMINYFLWSTTNDLSNIILYNLLRFFFSLLFYFFSSWISFKNIKYNYLISSISSLFLFIILLNSALFSTYILIILISIFTSLLLGSFYSGTNYLVTKWIKNSNETKKYFSIISLVGNLNTLLVPTIHGLIIYFFDFYASFIFMIFVSLFFVYFVLKLDKEKMDYKGTYLDFIKTEKEKYKYPKNLIVFIFLFSVVHGFISLTQGMVIVTESKNALELVFLSFIMATSLITIHLTLRKIKINSNYQLLFFLLGSQILAIFFLSNGQISFSIALFSISYYLARYFQNIYPMEYARNAEGEGRQILLLKREVVLASGRTLIFFLTFLFLKELNSFSWYFINSIIILIIFFLFFKSKKIEKILIK